MTPVAWDGVLFEAQFVPGGPTTDLTPWLDSTSTIQTQFGRSNPGYGASNPGTLTVTLDNLDGRFTPHRQTLVDGTPHPYWPNLKPRVRVRFWWLVNGGQGKLRFDGFVSGWPVSVSDGTRVKVTLTASTVDERLQRVSLQAPIRQEVLGMGAAVYWPLTEPSESVSAADSTGTASRTLTLDAFGTPPPVVTFGQDGPPSGDGTAMRSLYSTSGGGAYVRCRSLGLPAPNGLTISVAVKVATTSLGGYPFLLYSNNVAAGAFLDVLVRSDGYVDNGAGGAGGISPIDDGKWHHLAATLTPSGNLQVFVDGFANPVVATPSLAGFDPVSAAYVGYLFDGWTAHAAIFDSVLTNAQIATLSKAVQGFAGETVDERIARLLAYGGIAPGDMILDPSRVTLNAAPQDGVTVIDACTAAVESEGGGAILFWDTSGIARFRNRDVRAPIAPVLTIDAVADLGGGSVDIDPGDSTVLTSEVQAQQDNLGDTLATVTVNNGNTDPSSISFTSYATDLADVRHNAEDRLAQYGQPQLQLTSIPLELTSAESAGLYPILGGLYEDVNRAQLATRIQVTNLAPAVAGSSVVNGIVESFSDSTSADGTITVTFGTSPADIASAGVWGNVPEETAWQCDGSTLHTTLTATGTTVVIDSPKVTFTTDPAMYPLTITIGEERVTLPNPPGGSTSPQTFTGATRGAAGTYAAAQAAGSPIDLYPASTWGL